MVISVINNKGGTGKTTTSVNLAAALAISGYRTLLIDLDSQASASLSLGIKYEELSPSSADVLFHNVPIEKAIRTTSLEKFHILSGGIELAHSDLLLADVTGRENKLSHVLSYVKNDYDFIICDCAPSLSMIPVNAFLASDKYIVPVAPEYLALEGLVSLMDGVSQIESGMGIKLELLGIVFTMVKSPLIYFLDGEYKHQMEIVSLVKGHYNEKVFKTLIRKDLHLSKSPSYGKSVFQYNQDSPGAEDYKKLAEEVILRCKI